MLPTVTPEPSVKPVASSEPRRRDARRATPLILAATLVIIALAIGIFAFGASDHGTEPKPTSATTPTTPVTLPPSLQGPFDELQRAARP
jgi:hypothetical protein